MRERMPMVLDSDERMDSLVLRVARSVRRLLVLLGLALGGYYIFFYFAQTPLIFHSEKELLADPGNKGWAFEDVRLDIRGETTHGWFIPLEAARGVVLFCHGNGGNISNRLGAVVFFRSLGFSVLLFDYGGYGESTGAPSEKRVYADAMAMWEYLVTERGIPAAKIVVWGRSFGGGAACDLASRVKAGAAVLESTFLSKAEATKEHIPGVPWGLLIRHRFSNASKVHQIASPLLVIHSRDDTLFPLHHGQGLYERATESKTFLEVRGDHNDIGRVSDKLIREGVTKFLSTIPSLQSSPASTRQT